MFILLFDCNCKDFFLPGKCSYRCAATARICVFSYCLGADFWFSYTFCAVNDANPLTQTMNMCGCLHAYMLCPLQAEDTDLRLSLPECHPSRYPLLTLAKDYQNIKLPPDMFMPGENQSAPPPKPAKSRWRNITHAEWVKAGNYFSVVGGKKWMC